MAATIPNTLSATEAEAIDRRVAAGRSPARVYLFLRILIIIGEAVGIAVAGAVLHVPVRYGLCLGLVGAVAALTVAFALMTSDGRNARPWEIGGQLVFDVLQFSALLYLTGGANPFGLLLIVPVTVAGAMLRRSDAIAIAGLALACLLLVAILSVLFPAVPHVGPAFPMAFRVGGTVAVSIAIAFACGYASHAAAEAKRMALALHVTETVLAREQRLSALGGLAAAAAHELGTPLATITIVARELSRELPPGAGRDDALLMVEQAIRCRDILKRLAETPEAIDDVHERMTLLQLVREILAPYAREAATPAAVRAEAVVTGSPGTTAPDIWRQPEVLHALASFVENAFDFAKAEILVTARFDADTIAVEVRDDGPGFAPEVVARLGEPYVTSRPGAEGSRTGHVGMGLGFFIAKTLLERTGGEVSFRNAKRGAGAVVTVRWPRSLMEARESSREELELAR
jgi:two-component system sensor histidine kinase RegB